MIDHENANRVLLSNPEFMQLRQRFNTLGIVRLFVYIAAIILAIVSGLNQAYGVLIFGLIASFIIVMILNYNRAVTRAKQQGLAIRLGLMTEDDLR